MKPRQTLYDILEVSPHASDRVIQAAYRCLVQMNHPDRNLGTPQANERLSAINRAYSVLSDADQRRRYDQSMASRSAFVERRGRVPAAGSHHAGGAQVKKPESRPFAFRPLV